jgi:CRISPR-associated protein Cpf1
MRFKQVRGGIEKSVYQQLEKALIDKLNYLVVKNEINPERAGHILCAYQLTAPFETFKDMGKQTGILFYTQAEYTSQTDPVSGFRKNVYISNSETVEKIKMFIEKIDKIGWDSDKQSYYFAYNPINFVDKKFKDNTFAKDWTVYANVPRIKREKKAGYWQTVSINPNEKLKELFELWDFENFENEDMKDHIFQMYSDKKLEGTKEFDGRSRNFWHSFIYLFNLVLQVRNSTATQYKNDDEGNVVGVIDGVDFLSSPVKPFFCTDGGTYTDGYVNMAGLENKFIGDSDAKIKFAKEFNGDANGAYNIARKGIVVLQRIGKNSEKPDLFISKKDWDTFTSNN